MRFLRWPSVLGAVGIWAAVVPPANAGGELLTLPLSVRQLGMGSVAVTPQDVLTAWMNPALLGRMTSDVEVTGNGGYVNGLDVSSLSFGGAAGWRGLRGAVLGSRLAHSYPEVDEFGADTGKSLADDQWTYDVAAALQVESVGFGIGVKQVSERLPLSTGRVSMTAVDLGGLYVAGPIDVEIALANMGKSGMGLPGSLRGGAGYRIRPWNLAIGLDGSVGSDGSTAGVGLEWWPSRFIAFRAGGGPAGGLIQYAAGLTAQYWSGSIDYSFSTTPVGPINRFGATYKLPEKDRQEGHPVP